MGKKIAVVYNPNSRHGQKITRKKIERLARQVDAEPIYMKRLIKGEEFAEIIEAAVAEQPDIVIVAGGDGTVRVAIEQLIGGDTPLLIWPTGTANILAKNLALRPDDESIFALINEGEVKQLHVGLANGHVFTVGAAIGISTKVFENLHDSTKSVIGSWAYLAQGVVEFGKHRPFECTLETATGEQASFTTHQVTVLNGDFSVHEFFNVYPKHNVFKETLRIHTHAETPYKVHHLANAIRQMQKGDTGEHVKTWESHEATITAHPKQVVSLDAEIITETPITLKISDEAAPVIVPKQTQ